MEISERFSYHSQILESMVARGVKGGAAKPPTSGLGLPRVPVCSTTPMTEREGEEEAGSGGVKLVSKGGSNGDLHVDSPKFSIGDHSRSASPDSDDQTDAAGAVSRTKSLR